MSADREPIGVIGTGYVGLVTAAGFAELGSDVHCIDIDAEKIARLQRGEIPIYEPGLSELVARNAERMHFSTDLAEALEHARLLFVAVGTPPTYSGDADLSAVHAVVDAMPASDHHALVMKSTVPVGTGAAIKRRFAETGKQGFRYVSCPEFLKEGSAVKDFLHPDRVVVGDDGDWAGEAVAQLYAPLDAPLVRTDIASAEMVKLASNAFLATKISFINEIANVCEETGANVIEVARGMGLDDRIGPKFLQAGLGFGGSCLAPNETVLVRYRGRTTLLTFEQLWRRLEGEAEEVEEGVLEPHALEVLSFVPELGESLFLPVMCVTRRDYEGEMVTVRTKMGRSITVTPDHPLLVSDGRGAEPERKLAGEVTTEDWLPLAVDRTEELAVATRAVEVRRAAVGLAPAVERVRLDAALWRELGREQAALGSGGRVPDLLWDQPADMKRAFLAGFEPSAGLERFEPSAYLPFARGAGKSEQSTSDGILRLLADVHAVATFDRVAAVVPQQTRGPVYSMEVPGPHTFVTSGGIAIANCFPKDVSALKQLAGNSGYHFQLLNAVIEVNELQKRRVIGKLQKHLGSLVGKRIALLGLAFKPNTDDMREATSLVLSARLQAAGSEIAVYDPIAEREARKLIQGVRFASDAMDCVRDADAVVLVTEWDEFTGLDWAEVAAAMRGTLVIDGRNALDPAALGAAGLAYEGVGRHSGGLDSDA